MEKEKQLWFKAKSFGWGWTPCTWQGWCVLFLFLFGILSDVYLSSYVAKFYAKVIVMTTFLIIICYLSGEKPGWRWGNKKKDESDKE